MKRRKAAKRPPIIESNNSSESEDDVPLKKLNNSKSPLKEVSIADRLNAEFSKIEKDIFAGVTRLSDSDSEEDIVKDSLVKENQQRPPQVEGESQPSTSATGERLTFRQLEEYTKKIEEAKRHVEEYNARKKVEVLQTDISNILAAGEANQNKLTLENIKPEDLHSSDFESCDSEQEDWEEVKIKDSQETKDKSVLPKDGIQITVNMPDTCRKKKGVDLLAAMKRRLNRIRKENQVYVHKVHLLCWIAHGNYVNSAINNSQTLALALSLLPSDKCYPADRTDLGYLEQIVQWYKRTIKVIEKPVPKDLELVNALQLEPLKPPGSELHSLSKDTDKNSKTDNKKKKTTTKISKDPENKHKKLRQKSYGKMHEVDKKETDKEVTKNQKVKLFKADPKVGKTELKHNEDRTRKKIENVSQGKQRVFLLGSNKPNKKVVSERGSKDLNIKEQSTCSRSLRSRNKETSQNGTAHLTANERTRRSKSEVTVEKQSQSEKSTHLTVNELKTKRPKSEDITTDKKSHSKPAKKNLDGTHSSSDEETCDIPYLCEILQLDGANDDNSKKSNTKKPNLKKLSAQVKNNCELKKHPSRFKPKDEDYNSENEFRPRSPLTKKNSDSPKKLPNRKVNLQKLKSPVTNKPGTATTSNKKQLDVKNDIMNLIKGRITEQKHLDRNRMVKKRKPYYESNSDSDYMPEPIKKKHHDSDSDLEYFVPKPKVKQRVSVLRNVKMGQKIVSSSDETSVKKTEKGINVWLEVFLEAEEKWISVDLVQGQVHCVNELYTRATHPVSYVVAWNNDNTLKDITMRYCKSFNTITRKLRVDSKWWEETLRPFKGANTARDKEEDDDLNRQQLDQPMPKSIAEYKNNPLYVLRRHLLKFEAIYPSDVQPLGYVRSEPVYPRNCVYTCRSRDIWLKEAKVVKPGEKPYKIVKARPKYDKLSNKVITDQLLEIFGPWQTMDYEPPTAENGIVPRNAFGNVELFKSCMLPKGTVHLKLPGLNKIARRMNIDCASAIVGFDFHGGWSHPTYDGFVVCEEYTDVLVAAWELEQEEIEKKENEKIEKRVYGNWKKLIRGLLIRERLKAKYDFGSTSGEGGKNKKNQKGPRFCTKKRRIYSDSESDSDKT
ncbi:hypothetical protein NQ317_011423 [Molorchus minor]|uniref:DNA repair protein complementing XP-C cells homolog n=1 Tax=Molorchus minor TaxID=1323400 RepID=A0ABQ9JPJ2_9CUCU|nr:hypothetical protein NQ317_011423 [Molorchus minor]